MEGNEEERRALVREYYRIYRLMQKQRNLREHSHFDIYGNNLIEIWEYEGEKRVHCICRVKEETETACYRRAAEMLYSYSRKDTVKHEKKAG